MKTIIERPSSLSELNDTHMRIDQTQVKPMKFELIVWSETSRFQTDPLTMNDLEDLCYDMLALVRTGRTIANSRTKDVLTEVRPDSPK